MGTAVSSPGPGFHGGIGTLDCWRSPFACCGRSRSSHRSAIASGRRRIWDWTRSHRSPAAKMLLIVIRIRVMTLMLSKLLYFSPVRNPQCSHLPERQQKRWGRGWPRLSSWLVCKNRIIVLVRWEQERKKLNNTEVWKTRRIYKKIGEKQGWAWLLMTTSNRQFLGVLQNMWIRCTSDWSMSERDSDRRLKNRNGGNEE